MIDLAGVIAYALVWFGVYLIYCALTGENPRSMFRPYRQTDAKGATGDAEDSVRREELQTRDARDA